MATQEQIGQALKVLQSQGKLNTPEAKKLALAYRQGSSQPYQPNAMQAAGAAVTADPRSQAQSGYDLALQNVKQVAYPGADQGKFDAAAKDLLGPLNPQQIAQNDQLFGFGGELSGAANAVGDMFRGVDPRRSFMAWQQLQDARRNLGVEQSGPLGEAASILGQLTSIGGPGKVAAATAIPRTTGQRALQIGKDVLTSGTTGAVMGGVQGFGSTDGDVGQRLRGAQSGAIAGGAVGAAAPFAVRAVAAPFERMAQRGAVNAAIKDAPDASELSATASKLFDTAKTSGVNVKPQAFNSMAHDLVVKANARDIDADLDGSAITLYKRLVQMAQAGAEDQSALSISKLHNMRQKAQDVAFSADAKPRTKVFAQEIIDGIDSLMKPENLTAKPTNLLASGPQSGTLAGNLQLKAISTWSKAKKVGLIESAINAAPNYLSGSESGLRSQFKTLLNNQRYKNLWTTEERKALQEVVGGGPITRALRIFGMFRGFGGLAAGNAVGGPAGAIVGGLAGAAGRTITERATEAAATRAAKIVASPNIPKPGLTRIRVPYTTAPLLTSGQRQ